MEFRLVDLSPALYGADVPPARSGKFVQLVDADGTVETLVLSPYELSKYHAQVLERYCAMNGIDGRYLKMPVRFEPDPAEIEVLGGGHWRIDETARQLTLGGESTAYGAFRRRGLAERIRALPEFRAYDVAFE